MRLIRFRTPSKCFFVLGAASAIFLASASASSQSRKALLLPHPQHLAGVVVDEDGKPIAKAEIGHSNDPKNDHETNQDGHFELTSTAPVIVIRKPGYRSQRVSMQDVKVLQVTLRRLPAGGKFPSCASTGRYLGIPAFSLSGAADRAPWGKGFQFPKSPDIRATHGSMDVDYYSRRYFAKTKAASGGIWHGSGPMWGGSTPSDEDVWQSAQYEEAVYSFGDLVIVDARGQLPSGKRWRNLGRMGESASYSDADTQTAEILDRFMDRACLMPGLAK